MPIKLIVRKLNHEADLRDEEKFNKRVANSASGLEEFKKIEKIWSEAGKLSLFDQINTNADWEKLRSALKITGPKKYLQLPVYYYLIRIASIVILTAGLSFGIYKTIVSVNRHSSGFISIKAENTTREIKLPDASTVSLNAGSKITYNSDFGHRLREVMLEGEALFDVIPDKSHPFKVYIGESVISVTGTRFTVREDKDLVRVSVLAGTVLLSNTAKNPKQIRVSANQSGVLISGKELKIENGIEANTLSWKTGHLVFDQTPIDSALIDIAHYFRKELSIETEIKEEITAEFQNQPLREILSEIHLVAGLKFDTTGTKLIVRK